MQSNNNYANTLDPDLRGSVDYDFFSSDEKKEDERPKDPLGAIDEGDGVSQSSGDNSFNTASIGELGGQARSAPKGCSPSASPSSSSSSAASSPSPPPSRASSSSKSASTIRSGGFSAMPRGDSTRPMSPTPPSSHTSPSPHLLRSPVVPGGERPRSAAGSRRSDRSAASRQSRRSTRSVSSSDSRSRDSSRSASSRDSRRSDPSTPRRKASSRSRSASSASSRSSSPRRRSSASSRSRSRSEASYSSSASSRTASPKGNGSAVSSEESDVTDVSPLSSKNASPLGSPTAGRKPPLSSGSTRHHKDQVHFRKGKEEGGEEEEQLNVELIMKAILELDRERQGRPLASTPGSVSSKRSVSSERQPKKNYSFDSQRCHQIESENRRLLDSLLGQSGRRRASTGATTMTAPPRPYHSTINRIREQRRIEEENLQILKRLEKVRATPNMSRDKQLRDYQRQTNYGIVVPGTRHGSSKGRRKKLERSALPESEASDSRPQSRANSASRPSSAGSKASGRAQKPKPASSRADWPSGW